jgi:hypothetical protein
MLLSSLFLIFYLQFNLLSLVECVKNDNWCVYITTAQRMCFKDVGGFFPSNMIWSKVEMFIANVGQKLPQKNDTLYLRSATVTGTGGPQVEFCSQFSNCNANRGINCQDDLKCGCGIYVFLFLSYFCCLTSFFVTAFRIVWIGKQRHSKLLSGWIDTTMSRAQKRSNSG